jgi:PmbA protein
MERDYWVSMSRRFAALEPPADIGRMAAKRALRRLGGKKVETQRVPVSRFHRGSRSAATSRRICSSS